MSVGSNNSTITTGEQAGNQQDCTTNTGPQGAGNSPNRLNACLSHLGAQAQSWLQLPANTAPGGSRGWLT